MSAHGGGGDALARGQLTNADAGRALDSDEERHLPAGHAQGMHFPAKLSVDLQQKRSQPVSERDGICGDGGRHENR